MCEALDGAIAQVYDARPDFTANDFITLIGEVFMRTLEPYGDADFLREVFGVPDPEIPAILKHQEQTVDQIGQLPLW